MLYSDGTVQLNHGGTEMGQGLHTKMLAICAHELGVAPQSVRAMPTATDKVPNTSATAASSGSDLNGQAVKQACETLRERLTPVAARLLGVPAASAGEVLFAGGKAFLEEPAQLALRKAKPSRRSRDASPGEEHAAPRGCQAGHRPCAKPARPRKTGLRSDSSRASRCAFIPS